MTTLTSGKEAERVLGGRGEREPAVSREGQGGPTKSGRTERLIR